MLALHESLTEATVKRHLRNILSSSVPSRESMRSTAVASHLITMPKSSPAQSEAHSGEARSG
jgi:hypothetical protein